MERFGRIDGLVANAQTFRSVMPLEDVTAKDMDIVLDTGPKGTLWLMQAVFPIMRDRGWGRIVTMGSNAALLGASGYGPYVSSKEAIRGLTRVAAREWGKYGILVNCVCPVSAAHRAPPEDDVDRRAIFEATYKNIPLGRDGVVEDDIAPLLQGLEGDACQAPHWGYVISGTVVVTYPGSDRPTDRCVGGDCFHWPAGHSVRVDEDAEVILFSPHHAHAAVIDHMKAKLEAMA